MFCKYCGKEMKEDMSFCPYCGKGLAETPDSFSEGEGAPVNNGNSDFFAQYETPVAAEPENTNPGNLFLGIIGACLFSLVGVAAFVAIFQLGVITGLCSVLIFFMADLGYGLFTRSKNKFSIPRTIIVTVVTLVAVIAAQYIGYAVGIYLEFHETAGITIRDSFLVLNDNLLTNSEFQRGFITDFVFNLIFTVIALIATVISRIKMAKKMKK